MKFGSGIGMSSAVLWSLYWISYCSPEMSSREVKESELARQTHKINGSGPSRRFDVVNMSAAELEKIVAFPLLQDYEYTGFYTARGEPDKDLSLHGPFAFKSAESYSELDMKYKRKIQYTGYYQYNRKVGHFVESFYEDDSVDIFHTWTVTVFYSVDKPLCSWAHFSGRMGHVMPETRILYENPNHCHPGYFVKKTWKEWTGKQG